VVLVVMHVTASHCRELVPKDCHQFPLSSTVHSQIRCYSTVEGVFVGAQCVFSGIIGKIKHKTVLLDWKGPSASSNHLSE
jgi:hypothetical protein